MTHVRRCWLVLLVGGLLVAGGCNGEDPGTLQDVGVEEDAGGDPDADGNQTDPDVGDEEDTGGSDADAGPEDAGEDAGDAGDAGEADAGEIDPNEDYDWPCPVGQREDADGECVNVPTLRLVATDSLSITGEDDFSDPEVQETSTRMIFVSASSSSSDGSLPRENLGEADRCRAYGMFTGAGTVESFDAGPVTVVGLRHSPATFTPSDTSSVYAAPPQVSMSDAYPEGAEFTIMGAGTEPGQDPVFPSFEEELHTVAPGEFSHDAIDPGQPLEVTWTPSDHAEVVRIDIETRQGGMERIIVCEVVDTGSYAIPGELTSLLIEDAEDQRASLYQSRTLRIEPDDSQVLILLTASNWMRILYLPPG